jgi:hypothetical protein
MHLHRPDDAIGAAGDEKYGPGMGGGERATPPGFRIGDAHRREKAHGGPGVDGVNKKFRQRADVGVRDRQLKPFDAVRGS